MNVKNTNIIDKKQNSTCIIEKEWIKVMKLVKENKEDHTSKM